MKQYLLLFNKMKIEKMLIFDGVDQNYCIIWHWLVLLVLTRLYNNISTRLYKDIS